MGAFLVLYFAHVADVANIGIGYPSFAVGIEFNCHFQKPNASKSSLLVMMIY
ncbi:Uncharacterised protein [Fluoribacter dumoffii]|uniref:Uncharacterized protein n=1 Tax=Fluoribacter dumoffii TaxID=463 RepID=A0A377ITP6_9GAMM|nr:Uncharacterised protein [Fluoribacter dumoffii]STO91774.1 Uncharacterised protein [Fluoribacter dumoffii]